MADTLAPADTRSIRAKQGAMVLVVLVAIALMLLAAEGAVRVRQALKYGSASTLEDHWLNDPGTGLRVPRAGFSSGRISINSLGFRGPEIAGAKPAGTVRLAFLGASTTWCAEVSGNEYVWPHLVTAELQNAFPGARLDYVNAGVPGYTMSTILRNLQHRVAPLRPDVIVIYELANNLSGEMREIAAQRGIIATARMQEFSRPSDYSLLWYLVEKNLRLLSARRTAEVSRGRLEIDTATLGQGYRHDLTAVVRAAQRSARLVAIATFSIHLRPGQTPEEQLKASESAVFYMPFATPELLIDVYARYNQIVREVARDTGALLIEGENEIPGDPAHFTDTVHFTDAGSKVQAQRISRSLSASPLLREIVGAGSAPPRP